MSICSACVEPWLGNQSIWRQISTPITDAIRPIDQHPRERVLLVRGPLFLGRAQSARESIQRPPGKGLRSSYLAAVAVSARARPLRLDGAVPWWRRNAFANWAGCL